MLFTLGGTNLDAPDAKELAGFYRQLLGWTVVVDDPGWVVLRPPGGGLAGRPGGAADDDAPGDQGG
jgi:hypothetical protein